MNRVLICNDRMDKIAGSEMHVLELAMYFRDAGCSVTVASFLFGRHFLGEFDKHGIEAVELKSFPVESDWDVVWTHHVSCFHELHVLRTVRARKFIHGILSVIVPIELPPFSRSFVPDSANFSIYSNSQVTKDFVAERVNPLVDVKILRNLAPKEWWCSGDRIRRDLRRIVVVSNHAPQEVKSLPSSLLKHGVEVVFIGGRGARSPVTPKLLNEFDAVITIGKTVQYALAMGVPVFLYDYFGGVGWLDAENIDRAEYFNYNGKCSETRWSTDELSELLVTGYSAAVRFAGEKTEWARNRYGVAEQLGQLNFEFNGNDVSVLISDDIGRRDVAETLKNVKSLAIKKKWMRRLNRWRSKFLLF